MKRTDITRTIASLLITAAMLGVTGCGNVNTDTSSAAPKATTTAAETTETGTMTSRSATTTSHSSISVSSSSSVTSSALGSSGSSSAPKNTMMTAKTNSSKASNGGTVNNGGQSYSHSTSNNGSGNNSYSNDNNNSYQPQQTERQTERQTTTKRQTTTTAKKTQAPKPKPTTTAKPKFKLTQSDIDRVVKELQQYSNETCDFDAIFYTEQEMWDNIATRNLDNSSWGTPYTVLPDTYSSCDELYGVVKGGIKDLYGRIGNDQAHIVVYQQWHGDGSAINSGGKPAWEIYLLY